MKRNYIKYRIFLCVCLLFILMLYGFYNTAANTQQIVYTSPKGTNTLLVRYDYVSRPTIYKKGLLWNKKIWEYNNSGFMETVYFNLEWLSENQIRFTYDDENDEFDEEYIITIS